jgi:hypothetical protein
MSVDGLHSSGKERTVAGLNVVSLIKLARSRLLGGRLVGGGG